MPVEVLGFPARPKPATASRSSKRGARPRDHRLSRAPEARKRRRADRHARLARTDDEPAQDRRAARNSRWSSRATCRARSKRSSARSTSSAPTKWRARPACRRRRHHRIRRDAGRSLGAADHRLQRARPQGSARGGRARGIEIRYYNIIYNLVDDVKKAMSGLLAPTLRETMLGNAQILEVFNVSKVGKVAGCRVTDGTVERGANVRLIRDNVVIHEGKLSQLKRFKDDVQGSARRPGMRHGLRELPGHAQGDVIECYRVERSSARCESKSHISAVMPGLNRASSRGNPWMAGTSPGHDVSEFAVVMPRNKKPNAIPALRTAAAPACRRTDPPCARRDARARRGARPGAHFAS
jgi:hypothetical protein